MECYSAFNFTTLHREVDDITSTELVCSEINTETNIGKVVPITVLFEEIPVIESIFYYDYTSQGIKVYNRPPIELNKGINIFRMDIRFTSDTENIHFVQANADVPGRITECGISPPIIDRSYRDAASMIFISDRVCTIPPNTFIAHFIPIPAVDIPGMTEVTQNHRHVGDAAYDLYYHGDDMVVLPDSVNKLPMSDIYSAAFEELKSNVNEYNIHLHTRSSIMKNNGAEVCFSNGRTVMPVRECDMMITCKILSDLHIRNNDRICSVRVVDRRDENTRYVCNYVRADVKNIKSDRSYRAFGSTGR
jgi:hypothetical protein